MSNKKDEFDKRKKNKLLKKHYHNNF